MIEAWLEITGFEVSSESTGVLYNLPSLSIESHQTRASFSVDLSVASIGPQCFVLPGFEIEGHGYGGGAGDALTSVQVEVAGSAIGGLVAAGSYVVPSLQVSSHGYSGNIGTANLEIDILELVGGGWTEIDYSAELLLPLLALEAYASQLEEESYRGVAINLRHSGITEYHDFTINSSCYFSGQRLGANSQGIHLLTGDRDSDAPIDAGVRSGVVIEEDHPEKKRVMEIYPSIKTDGGYFVGTVSDGNYIREYQVEDSVAAMHNGKVHPAKGLKSNYWGVSFRNANGADFELESIELITEAGQRL